MDSNCIICEKSLETGKTVKITQKGVRAIVEASLEREDGISTMLQNLAISSVHEECRKSYTRKTSIISSKKQKHGL